MKLKVIDAESKSVEMKCVNWGKYEGDDQMNPKVDSKGLATNIEISD